MRLINVKSLMIAILLPLSQLYGSQLFAENNVEIGKICPDFLLKNINNFSMTQAHVHDFRGKYLILDFYIKTCTGCIVQFPKINRWQREHKDDVVFLEVGVNDLQHDPDQSLQSFYMKFKKSLDLDVPYIFDSSLYKTYGIPVVGMVVINRDGIVADMLGTIDDDYIRHLLDGDLEKVPDLPKFSFDYNKAFLIDSNGGIDSQYMFRSVISVATPSTKANVWPDSIFRLYSGRFQVLSASLPMLYNYAYIGMRIPDPSDTSLYGKYYIKPALEMKDSSLFVPDFRKRKNLFCYSLSLPSFRASKSAYMVAMQHDLENCFGYQVSVEERMMPCWRITATEEAKQKLKSKGGKRYISEKLNGEPTILKNVEFRYLVSALQHYHPNMVILDETNIDYNIDIQFDGYIPIFDDVQKALKEHGIVIVSAEKLMKVIVIRDR